MINRVQHTNSDAHVTIRNCVRRTAWRLGSNAHDCKTLFKDILEEHGSKSILRLTNGFHHLRLNINNCDKLKQ